MGAGQPQVPEVRSPTTAPARSSQPLGSRWVQVGCAFGGGALRRASCGQHPVSVGMGGPQARGGKAGQHLQPPHTCRALLLRRRSQGLRGILAPQATSEDTARSGDCPGMTGVHGPGPITGASQPHRSRGTVGSALRGLPATWACILHPLAQAPRGTTTAPDSQALPRSPPHSARKEEMQQDLRVGHGRVREHPRGARRRAWGLRPPGS